MVRGVREALRTRAGRVLVEAIEHSVIGRYEAIRNPIRSGGARPPLGNAPPSLGQHTEAVLSELGFDADDIRRLRHSGVIG